MTEQTVQVQQTKDAPVFRPKPYIFRSQENSGTLDQIGPDKCLEQGIRFPEFNLLLDHTLAVVWMCEDPKICPIESLSEEQLQWAIRFLISIRSSGKHDPSDIGTIIDQMQNLAFNKHRTTKRKRPLACRSLPAITGASSSSESFSIQDVMSRLCADKFKEFVQLLGVGDASKSTSVA